MLACVFVTLCFACCCRAIYSEASNVAAYLTYTDGTIAQYKFKDGKLIALEPASLRVGGFPGRVVADPEGQYAYIASGNTIFEFKVGINGTLIALKPKSVDVGCDVEDTVIDRSGNYLYATSGCKNKILQYRIGKDGQLSLLSPSSLPTGESPSRIAVHPTKPFLYVSNLDGSISQYRISEKGTLSPLDPPDKRIGGATGCITFSSDGSAAYITDQQREMVNRYKVADNGSLAKTAEYTYHYELDNCCGMTTMAIDPKEQSLYVTKNIVNLICGFQLVEDDDFGYRLSAEYFVTRTGRLRTRDEVTDDIRKQYTKDTGKQDVDKATIWEYNDAEQKIRKTLGMVSRVCIGPDGHVYVLCSSGVLRCQAGSDAKLVPLEPAIEWPDTTEAGKEALKKNEVPHLPSNLVFVQY